MNQNAIYYPKTQSKGQIVCMSSTHWHFLWQRPQQIMSRLSRDYNILYVDPPYPVSIEDEQEIDFNLKTYHARLKTINSSLKVFSPLKIAHDDSKESVNITSENSQFIADQIQNVLLSMKWYRPLLWIYDLAAVSLVNKLEKQGVVYDCVDSFASFSWADPDTQKWENELMTEANLILTSSKTLFQARAQNHPHTYLVPNAADFQHFCKTGNLGVEPNEMKAIKRPRLGFVGAVYEWLDFDLIEKLANHNPHWQIIIIGPKQHNLEVPEGPNIHWLGTRDYKILPLYIQSQDLMLIPFLSNEVTKHANPIKLWEYLAAGKAVVSTRLPEVPEFPGVIWLSDNYLDFITNCNNALNSLRHPLKKMEITQKAQMLAKYNSWDERCKLIRSLIQHYFKM